MIPLGVVEMFEKITSGVQDWLDYEDVEKVTSGVLDYCMGWS